MKSKIINNVEEKPNFFEFNGEKLDIQFGMYALARIKEQFSGGVKEVLKNFGKSEVVFFVLSTLINEALIVKGHEEGREYTLTTPLYVEAKTTPQKFNEATRAIATAMGLSLGVSDPEQAEIDREIDEALEGEDIEDADEKNLKTEQTTS